MTDANNNPDCVIELNEDNAEAGLKEEDQLQKKYFNGGKLVLTRINVENIKKKQHPIKRPIGKWEFRFLMITIIVIFCVIIFGYIYLSLNEEK